MILCMYGISNVWLCVCGFFIVWLCGFFNFCVFSIVGVYLYSFVLYFFIYVYPYLLLV